MVVIVPSRGRPQNIERLIKAWSETNASADLLVAIDKDDPEVPRYMEVLAPTCNDLHVAIEPRRRLCGTLNHEAMRVADKYDVVGFLGDDHLPQGDWSTAVDDALTEMGTGIVYGNDLIQGPNLPTAVFMTSDIVRALGYMAPPALVHLFLDNYWKSIGEAIGRLRYLPDVIIEHLHPLRDASLHDASYQESWSYENADALAYRSFVSHGEFAQDVQKLQQLLSEGTAA
jgi:hypothetical protein